MRATASSEGRMRATTAIAGGPSGPRPCTRERRQVRPRDSHPRWTESWGPRNPTRQEPNLYNYAGCNPTNRIDPTGLAGCSGFEAIALVMGLELAGALVEGASVAFTIGGLAASHAGVGLGLAAFGAAVLIIDQYRCGCPEL